MNKKFKYLLFFKKEKNLDIHIYIYIYKFKLNLIIFMCIRYLLSLKNLIYLD